MRSHNSKTLNALLQTSEKIRIYTDSASGHGFGNQAAGANLILYLRETMGYSGQIEFIYPAQVTHKIIKLFGLPESIPEIYAQENNITFYNTKAHLQRFLNGSLDPVILSLTGGIDFLNPIDSPLALPTTDMLREDNFELEEFQKKKGISFNMANVLNADIFVSYSQYHRDSDYPYFVNTETYFHLRNRNQSISQPGSSQKFWNIPLRNISHARNFLETEQGNILLKNTPALKTIFSAYENKSINFIPSYGFTLLAKYHSGGAAFYDNLIELIAGARYAQLTGNNNNPIIILLFYKLLDNELQQINRFICKEYLNDSFDEVERQLKLAISKFELHKKFSAISLLDSNATAKINSLKANEIMLVATGELPEIIFKTLYTHKDTNILMHVREGATSLTNLLPTTGVQLRCSSTPWELINTVADTSLNKRLKRMWLAICNPNKPINFITDFFMGYQPKLNQLEPAYKMIGDYIIDAQNPNSSVSGYFISLRDQILNPGNDRIAAGLEGAVEMLNNTLRSAIEINSSLVASSISAAVIKLLKPEIINEMLGAPTDMPTASITNPEINHAGTWLTIAAVSVAACAGAIVVARNVDVKKSFSYCKNQLVRTFYAANDTQIGDVEAQQTANKCPVVRKVK